MTLWSGLNCAPQDMCVVALNPDVTVVASGESKEVVGGLMSSLM